MATLVSSIQEKVLYRGGVGHFMFIAHRLAGLGVLFFLVTHIIDTSWVAYWPEGYAAATKIYATPPFIVGETFLVAALLFHGINGLKLIYLDRNPEKWSKELEAKLNVATIVASVLIWLPAAYVMLSHIWDDGHKVVTDSNPELGWINVGILLLLGVGMAGVWGMSKGKKSINVPKNFETRMYQFMRYSGVMLLPLAYGHVLIKDIIHGASAINLDYVALYWGTWGWRLYDMALLAFAFAHGMNGLKQVAEDYIHNPKLVRMARIAILAAWVLITAVGAYAIIAGVQEIA